jgi:hypothetical protein
VLLRLFAIFGDAMARAKSTATPRQPKDNVDLQVIDASTRDDTVEASSAFNQDAGEDTPFR